MAAFSARDRIRTVNSAWKLAAGRRFSSPSVLHGTAAGRQGALLWNWTGEAGTLANAMQRRRQDHGSTHSAHRPVGKGHRRDGRLLREGIWAQALTEIRRADRIPRLHERR